MKKILTVITLSISALVTTSAMADWNQNQAHHAQVQHQIAQQEWREGARFSDRYKASNYHVKDYRSYKNLHKPTRYERWYKVDGRYVLVNERNHHIVHIVR